MEGEHGKRKANDCPTQKNSPLPKTPRLNEPGPFRNNNSLAQTLNFDGAKGSDFTQKLVSIWLNEANCNTSPQSKNRDEESTNAQQKNQRTSKKDEKYLIQKMQLNIQNAEKQMSNLYKQLQSEKKANRELLQKLDSTGRMVTTMVDHINCTGDVLEKAKDYKEKLSSLFDTVILKQREERMQLINREAILTKQIDEFRQQVAFLKGNLTEAQLSLKKLMDENKDELKNAFEECRSVRNQLLEVTKQKEEISRVLATKEAGDLDYKNKIAKYEAEVNKVLDQLAKVSAENDIINEENRKLRTDLAAKSDEVLKMVEEFKIAKAQYSDKISSIQAANDELKTKISSECNERENIKKKMQETIEVRDNLVRQLEKLRAEKSVEIEEMSRKLESVELEKKEINEKYKKIVDELEKRYQDHVEKYECLIVEMKEAELRYQKELSRAQESSSTAMSRANDDFTRLNEELESLKCEKEDKATKLQQVESLLDKYYSSEVQLRRKLEQCQNDAAMYKTAQEARNEENAKKINELEQEILKLKVEQEKTASKELPENTEEIKNQNKKRQVTKKEITPNHKSILKDTGKSRKSRSTSTSPVIGLKKKITFLGLDSLETSPINFNVFSEQTAYSRSQELFDKLTAVEESSPQLLQPSQMKTYSLSQNQNTEKKFFKSRNHQPKV